MAIQELRINEIEQISGATNWNEFFTGVGMIGLGFGIAATPVGWLGTATAASLSYFGSSFLGDGYWGDGYVWGEYFQ